MITMVKPWCTMVNHGIPWFTMVVFLVGRLMLFCIHRVNRVYGTLVVTLWTCYGAL